MYTVRLVNVYVPMHIIYVDTVPLVVNDVVGHSGLCFVFNEDLVALGVLFILLKVSEWFVLAAFRRSAPGSAVFSANSSFASAPTPLCAALVKWAVFISLTAHARNGVYWRVAFNGANTVIIVTKE